ncbi:hypothetical protein CVT24_003130 [Panaeolus cyanescens]|uniref:Uncharacterized protein n=1 Tax=Panaeolus cyanescens TaxID=181874 RepID=A0A409W1R1_9AGAR|nr:hypothetical protein CVT24_003130 [Panaeolus cyanescens]
MSDKFQPPNLFTPTQDAPGEQEQRLKNPKVNDNNAQAQPGIAQSALQTAQGALQTVGETVKPYLPTTVASHLPGTTTTTSSTSTQEAPQSQRSVQVPAPQDSRLTTNVSTSLSSGNGAKENTTSALNTISAKAGDAANAVKGTAGSLGSSISGRLPESVGQYLPGQAPSSIPTGAGHQQVPSTNVAATTTIPPLTKPTNANTQTVSIAHATDIPPLDKPSSSIVVPAEVADATNIAPLTRLGDEHAPTTAIAPKKSTAVTAARVDLESRPSEVARTTEIPPLNKQDEHIVENTEVAGATAIPPLEKDATSASHASQSQSKTADAAHHVQSAAQRVENAAAHALPTRSHAKGDQTAHPKATTGDNLHAPATTTYTNNARGIPHTTTVTHTKDDPVHKVFERHGTKGDADEDGQKPSMKDKVKGEMKVIAGKIERKEEKVEEGKRMMGKTQN